MDNNYSIQPNIVSNYSPPSVDPLLSNISPKRIARKPKTYCIANLIIITLIILIGFYAYHNDGTDRISIFIRNLITKIENAIKKVFTVFEKKTNKVFDHSKNDIEKGKVYVNNLGKPISNNTYNNDNSNTSMIQKRGKTSYCYVGTDRGYRSCIEMGEEDICDSGETYNDERTCIYPSKMYR
jgi:hypothetical protein